MKCFSVVYAVLFSLACIGFVYQAVAIPEGVESMSERAFEVFSPLDRKDVQRRALSTANVKSGGRVYRAYDEVVAMVEKAADYGARSVTFNYHRMAEDNGISVSVMEDVLTYLAGDLELSFSGGVNAEIGWL